MSLVESPSISDTNENVNKCVGCGTTCVHSLQPAPHKNSGGRRDPYDAALLCDIILLRIFHARAVRVIDKTFSFPPRVHNNLYSYHSLQFIYTIYFCKNFFFKIYYLQKYSILKVDLSENCILVLIKTRIVITVIS